MCHRAAGGSADDAVSELPGSCLHGATCCEDRESELACLRSRHDLEPRPERAAYSGADCRGSAFLLCDVAHSKIRVERPRHISPTTFVIKKVSGGVMRNQGHFCKLVTFASSVNPELAQVQLMKSQRWAGEDN